MVRLLGFGLGLIFCAAAFLALLTTPHSFTHDPIEDFHLEPRDAHLSSAGLAAHFDRNQLRRGFRVYKEVCSACHGLTLVAFRDLQEGLGYSEGQVKTIAGEFQVASINPDTGEAATRPALPTDYIPSPYPNEVAARAANNNALPPDLSLITKAREGGANYVYSLITGYRALPANLPRELRPASATLHYNPYFHSLNIAMPPPLTSAGQVTFDDGSPNTVDAMARDVAAFLVWTAEPKLENRIQLGWAVLGFLAFMVVLSYLSYRTIWADKKH